MSYEDFPAPEDDERRRKEIEYFLNTNRDDYFRNEPLQKEYYDILTRQEGRERDKQLAMTPGPFDEALARFKASRASVFDGQEEPYDGDMAGRRPRLASNDATFVPANVPVKADDRYLGPRERLDRAEALFGLGSNEWAADASQPRNPDLTSRDETGNEEYPQVKMAASGGGRRPWSILEGVFGDAIRKGQIRRNSNARPELPWRTQTPEPTSAGPSPSMHESLSRIGRDAGPAFDRSSVKWGDVKSFDELPAYARDVARNLSNSNPRSDLPRFLFKLESPPPRVTNEISQIDKELGRALTERPAEISNYVVDKLYAKGTEAANKAFSALPDLLKNGVVHDTNERVKGKPRVAIAAPWGEAGDKLVAVFEMSRTGNAAEIVSVHPMAKNRYENRLRTTGKLSLGAGALLMLDLDENDE